MMFGYGGDWPFWQLALMGFAMIAFWGLIIWAVYFLVVGATRRNDGGPVSDGPRHILDQRLAKGEINPEQYSRARELIDHDDHNNVGTGVGS
jgi:putative membrane protein